MKSLLFGRFVKPFGIKGYLKVIFFSEGLQDLEYFSRFFIKDPRFGLKEFVFNDIIERDDKIVVKCSLAADRNEAELLRLTDIYVDEDELPEAEEGEYYVKDLVGCEVFEGSNKLGTVKDYIDISGQPLLLIRLEGKKELMAPFRKPYLVDVNIAEKVIHMQGLDELF